MNPVQNSVNNYWNLMSPNYPNPDNRILPITLYVGKYLFVLARRIIHFAFTHNFETDQTLFSTLCKSPAPFNEASEIFKALKTRVQHDAAYKDLKVQFKRVHTKTQDVQAAAAESPNEPNSNHLQTELTAKTAECESLTQAKASLTQRVNELTTQLEQLSTEYTQIIASHQESRQALDLKERKIQELSQKLEQDDNQVRSLREQATEKEKEYQRTLQSKEMNILELSQTLEKEHQIGQTQAKKMSAQSVRISQLQDQLDRTTIDLERSRDSSKESVQMLMQMVVAQAGKPQDQAKSTSHKLKSVPSQSISSELQAKMPHLNFPIGINPGELEKRIRSFSVDRTPYWYVDLTHAGNASMQKSEKELEDYFVTETTLNINGVIYKDDSFLNDDGFVMYIIKEENDALFVEKIDSYRNLMQRVRVDKSTSSFSQEDDAKCDYSMLLRMFNTSMIVSGCLFNLTDHSFVEFKEDATDKTNYLYVDNQKINLSIPDRQFASVLVEGDSEKNTIKLVLWEKNGNMKKFSTQYDADMRQYQVVELV